MKQFFYIAVFIFVLLLFSHCAQEGQLTGGPKDTIPPKTIFFKPPNPDTNFNQKQITIKFNEFFQLKKQEIFSSVPLQNKPKLKIEGKKLIINLNNDLKDSTTYFIALYNTVADITEKNTVKKLTYTFSTYNQIDTLQISGKLIDAYTLQPVNDLTVVLFKASDTLAPYSFPEYNALVDTSGSFTFPNLKKGNYKIFAFNDLNSNYQFDGFPENIIGFCEQTITPIVKIDTIIDSLPAGTPLKINDTITDTLTKDTVIIKFKTHFLPQNIIIRTFENTPDSQFIKAASRKLKGLLVFYFAKPIIDNFFQINFSPATQNFFIERQQGNDSIFVWLKDKTVFSQDSIIAFVSYYKKTGKTTTDTFVFYNPESALDTLPLKISYETDLLPGQYPKLTFYSIINNTDTSKIALFKIIDTTVSDPLLQKITAYRPNSREIIFSFSRPLQKQLKLKLPTLPQDTSFYNITYDSTKQKAFVKIIDDSLAACDTINITAFFDNLYFFNQIQNLKKNLKIPLQHQQINFQRTSKELLILTLTKKSSQTPVISSLNNPKPDFSITHNNDTVLIRLKSNFYDTLKFAVKYLDYIDANNKKIYKTDTIVSLYKYKGNPLLKAQRYARHKIRLIFSKPLTNQLKIKLLGKKYPHWYKIKHPRSDTVYLLITNNRLKRQNKIKFAIEWFDVSPEKDTVFHCDTLNLAVTAENTAQETSTGTNGEEKQTKLKLKEQIPFKIINDSTDIHSLRIIAKFNPVYEYLVKIDSAAFMGIYSRTNDTLSFKITFADTSQIKNIKIKIKNLGYLTSNNPADTNKLQAGKIILNIRNKDGKNIFTATTSKDTLITTPPLIKNSYSLQIIHDRNNDNLWNKGDIKKWIPPEKIFYLDLSPANENIIDFKKSPVGATPDTNQSPIGATR